MNKIIKLLLLISIAFGGASCSNKKVKQDEMASNNTSEELVIDDADFVVDADAKDEMATDAADTEIVGVETSEPLKDEMVDSSAPVITESEVYEVQKGETLMWISFKLYGDYRKWRELQANNQDVLADGVQVGDKIRYTPGNFVWNPKGLPHLIKSGDTLASISNEKYGTFKKWRSIWENNSDMIRDPNLIFAGFTLYYVPEERELASEQL
ncbi:LysM peptidoglycan-binding domain-containing protein [Bacteriovorax sp. Seq25_V]|uniref:LysM peptidoglycan-binding domain-containing protein n=1 Tax=Bacteriovorax sp. Seq25_V TaxID=1201288 RepID=UPI000389F233|nr:LysM peptidoglycan-binding domain-containing protein [Bacteriovorax sp. Seq25_V]EQC43560.1 LysM domain protein [Bacteriovorax sp. Seq25_V]